MPYSSGASSPFSPLSPLSPLAPGAPTAPMSPFAPVTPCGPTGPWAPWAPAGPCAPVAPRLPLSAALALEWMSASLIVPFAIWLPVISFAVPATAVPLSATASAIIATIIAGVKRLFFNMLRVLSVTRYPAAGCRGFDEKNVRAAEARSLDPVESSVVRRSARLRAARAAATASSRELTPRARKRRRMWFLTVSVLRWSSAAICFVERPCSSRRSTSTCRGVRWGCGAVACRRGVPPGARRRRPPARRS